MNDDRNDLGRIAGQGADGSWVAQNDDAVEDDSYNLLPGTEFYFRPGSENLWHLVHVRQGNVFNANGTVKGADCNYLPWSESSMAVTNSSAFARNQRDAGQAVMINHIDSTDRPRIVSPCYEEGIGRIYFDAVNFSTDTPNYIALYVSTNELYDTGSGTVSGEEYANWERAVVDVVAVVGGVVDESLSARSLDDNITLAMTAGGADDNFYRIVLADERFVNYRGKARFKIERLDHDGTGMETTGMVVVDNVICSFPAMAAELKAGGVYDSSLSGEQTIGWAGAFDTPLPSFGATGLVPVAGIEEIRNSGSTEEIEILDAKFHYRWRYLSQELKGVDEPYEVSSITSVCDRATVGGAVLHIPAVDATFTNRAVRINAIVLGNTSYDTAPKVQYIEVDGVRSGRLNGNGAYNRIGNHPDGSWILRYEFSPAVEVLTERDYKVTFLDEYGDEITDAPRMCLVNPSELGDSLGYALRVKDSDLARTGFNNAYSHFMAKVESVQNGGFATVDMDVAAGGDIAGASAIDDSYSAWPGDIEFYYTATFEAPYYRYVDYTGLDIDWADAELEKIGDAISRRPMSYSRLNSGGTDYFVRLRDGESGLKRFDVEMRNSESSSAITLIPGMLVADNTWQAFMDTATNVTKGVCQVRFRTVDVNDVTNYLKAASWTYTKWPDNIGNLTGATDGSSAWLDIRYGDETGYLRFQHIEDDRLVMVSRADFQNFNGWNDANLGEELFVGSSTETNSLKGVSNSQRTFGTFFDAWKEMPATSDYWTEEFVLDVPGTHQLYEHFNRAKALTLQATAGQWIHATYRSGTEYAVQLDGGGRGSLDFVNAAESPRGIGTVSYTARLAQGIDFDDFAYCLADDSMIAAYGNVYAATNYTFVAKGAMGYLNERHDGVASLSLITYYHPNNGCYEFRVTNTAQGNNYSLELYRWNIAGRKVVCTRLGGADNVQAAYAFDVETSSGNFRFPALFISADSSIVDGSTHIVAGIQRSGACSLEENPDGLNYNTVIYNDNSASRLTAGTCGAVSANCPGRIARPMFLSGSAKGAQDLSGGVYPWTDTGVVSYNSNHTMDFQGTASRMYDSLHDGNWDMAVGRMETYNADADSEGLAGTNWGLRCGEISQDVILSLADAGSNDFKEVATNSVSVFSLTNQTFDIFWPQDASVRLSTGGEDETTSADLVVSYFSFTQWRGDSYTNTEAQPAFNDRYLSNGCHTQIVFTTSWVHNTTNTEETLEHTHSVELSAARAIATNSVDNVVSIRSPLFDGESTYDHGIGLGMISFAYTNCNENVNLLLQICTNENASVNSLRSLTEERVDATVRNWVTVTNFVGSAWEGTDKDGIRLGKSGIASYYLGMHGVKGVMRIVMDPEVIEQASVARTGDYGRIFLTQVMFRDEPAVDTAAWWGWNMRTGNFLHSAGDERLLYLADGSTLDLARYGMSVALNNSTNANTLASDADEYWRHLPFIQTPTFADTGDGTPKVGEISFKARRYDTVTNAIARVTLYGASDANATDQNWKYITHFDIANNLYTNFTFRASSSTSRAYRLAVTGVEGANGMNGGETPADVVRVAIDNVSIAETIVPKLGFKRVMAFRSNLDNKDIIDYEDRASEQPLAGEDWGIQAEVYAETLPEEIDFTKPITVKVYYKDGLMPWGYENWMAAPDGEKTLLLCDGCAEGEYIFRSSFLENPASIFAATDKDLLVVQYMLEVTYYLKESSTPAEPVLMSVSGEWVKPEWYVGVDYNTKFAGMGGQAAYNILDAIAPGWAWINEANVFAADTSSSLVNAETGCQYVEVAIPTTADISGWHLDFITKQGNTNTVATFTADSSGDGYASSTKTKNSTGGMSFLVVASPRSTAALSEAEGERDGTWRWTTNGDFAMNTNGLYNSVYNPLAIQLVRASGIIEEQLVLAGTDGYAQVAGADSAIAAEYSNTNMVAVLTARAAAQGAASKWFTPGYDNGAAANSLSVTNSNGAVAANWHNEIAKTPGKINEGQVLPGDPPEPAGASVTVYCEIDRTAGHIVQTVGDQTETADTVLVLVPKGSEYGTNITYKVDNFFEIGSVTTNKVELADVQGAKGTVVVNVGKGVSNAVYVVTKAQPWSELVKPEEEGGYGLTEANAYTPAVLDWLAGGQLLDGTPFGETDGVIRLAEFHECNGVTNLTMNLTSMYWFDMDPTIGNLHFTAGLKKFELLSRYSAQEDRTVNDPRIRMYMAISNDNDKTEWSPYVLRGFEPGSNSQDLSGGAWTSATFKITANLQNDYIFNSGFMPVRWFVFGGSGRTSTSFDENHCTSIEILDQHMQGTPGAYEGWDEFWGTGIYYKWNVNDEMRPSAPEVLCPTNYYENIP